MRIGHRIISVFFPSSVGNSSLYRFEQQWSIVEEESRGVDGIVSYRSRLGQWIRAGDVCEGVSIFCYLYYSCDFDTFERFLLISYLWTVVPTRL